jgi:hypothetical protein
VAVVFAQNVLPTRIGPCFLHAGIAGAAFITVPRPLPNTHMKEKA